ncbi:uncharacterized protein LOC106647422 [Copidosoma floridanum]|uniref:uncharacterized protein LOC106647422 n=1 Tax=Copidosoma floridanum TaxID=29053 RepID=UPI0006C946AA|nr:uncharacterized protein LOC106647422 [Copidosoma floridanum]
MNWPSRWSPLRVLIFILLKCGTTRPMVAPEDISYPRLIVAASHTALSGDLGVLIIEMPTAYHMTTTTTTAPAITSTTTTTSSRATTQRSSSLVATTEDADASLEDDEDYSIENNRIPLQDPFVLRLLRLDGFTSELVGEVPVEVPNIAGVNVSLKIPCGYFSRGGTYSLQLQHKSAPLPDHFANTASLHHVQTHTTLDVRWPTPSLALEPQHFDTYPSQPVLATLEYTGITCSPLPGVPVPTFSVQLIYCGASVLSCDPRNKSHVQVLYKEEVKGFPTQRVVSLRCEYFGLAGHYALRLKPSDANPSAPTSSAYIKVEWSDLFVFNVRARSVYPCDGGSSNSGGGVSVLFEYPACRLQGDRVRVYGRLRADVASLAPPSTLDYVAELKAPPGEHRLTFDCDLFTERYVEYCFVYVSEAFNGAMSEVRVDCIPTFPLQEGDAGGWGPWSQWTPCSSSCVGGTRTRHRFCDTPPPRYGAKFCQGKTVESEACGGSKSLDLRGSWSPGDWECRHGEGLAADRPEVTAVVGSRCRCGCSLVLEDEEQRRILAASSRQCPGHSFWLVQTKPSHVVELYFDQARLPCQNQYVRVKDGDSLIDALLADVTPERKEPASGRVVSTGPRLLLEFYNEPTSAASSCASGFLAHVAMAPKPKEENITTAVPALFLNAKVMAATGRWALWLTPAHLVATSLLVLMFLATVVLALQYAFKYRKYHVAEDLDSLTDNSACSGSMQGIARRTRAMSSTTLISEVVSLVRLQRKGSPRHARLNEAGADVEEGYESTETQADGDDEDGSLGSLRRSAIAEEGERNTGSQRTIVASNNSVRSTPTKRSSNCSSTATLTTAGTSGGVTSTTSTVTTQAGQLHAEVKYARPVKLRTFGPVSPVSEEAASTSEDGRRFSATSASTSLNNGFSPASSSSNSTLRRCSGKESKERRNRERLLRGPGSEFSLANPDLDLELDYYDYNVMNAGAAPGSYLGMDPAFLVWIPPLDEDGRPRSDEEEHHYEEIVERPLDTEGAALTPQEYMKRVRTKHEDYLSEGESDDVIKPRKLDPGECRLHDEIIMEYKARLVEGMLPIHRLLEESRVRVSEESLSSNNADVIPNRLETRSPKTPKLPRRSKKSFSQSQKVQDPHSSDTSTQSLEESEPMTFTRSRMKVNDLDTPRTRRRLGKVEQDKDAEYCEVIVPRSPARRGGDLNASGRDEVVGVKGDEINIPMAEFSRNWRDSPVKVHSRLKSNRIQSPDQGVDVRVETKRSFYELIGEGEDGIKFADDDDEDYDIESNVVT